MTEFTAGIMRNVSNEAFAKIVSSHKENIIAKIRNLAEKGLFSLDLSFDEVADVGPALVAYFEGLGFEISCHRGIPYQPNLHWIIKVTWDK